MMFIARVLAAFVNSRMNKSGTQVISATAVLVINWTVDAAYGGTDIITNANKITIQGAGIKTVTAAVVFTGATSGWGMSAEIRKNGTLIGTAQSSTATGATLNFNIPTISFVSGDTLEVRASYPGLGSPTIQPTGTFIKVE